MYKTEQEKFWAGEFGDEYIDRNIGNKYVSGNINFFSKVFRNTKDIKTAIEFGANIGLNIMAIKQLLTEAKMSALEINANACKQLKKIDGVEVFNESILEFKSKTKWDFVLIKGVMIHLNPDKLQEVYEKLYEASNKYICIAEYYNPTPVAINYRGHTDKLFKRDFAGEMQDKYKDLELLDYGFTYRRDDYYYGNDDITWFLFKKR